MQFLTLIGPPVIATALSGWLRDTQLPKWLDTLIALVAVLITAFLWSLFAGKFVGDLVVDTTIITAYTTALIAGPMKPLHQWLMVKAPSPVALVADAVKPEPVAEEAPASPYPGLVRRSSLLDSGQTWTTRETKKPNADSQG